MQRFLGKAHHALLSSFVLLALSACGGGGSDTPNQPPRVAVLSSGDVRANAASDSMGVSLGGLVRLDAGSSVDPDKDALTYSWTLTSKPASSTLAIADAAVQVLEFHPDVLGSYVFSLKVTDARNGQATQQVTVVADNTPPTPGAVVQVTPVVMQAASSTITTSVGYVVQLDSSSASDPEGAIASRAWTLVSRPNASTATLSSTAAVTTILQPDVLGDYVVKLVVTDAAGAKSEKLTTIRANNRAPTAAIASNATPVALPTAPGFKVPVGTIVTFRGDSSIDADGDALTYLWSLDSRPNGSTASLSSLSAATPAITPDVGGNYVFRLRVTDTSGAFSERSVTMMVGNDAPVVVLDHTRVTVELGGTVSATAALSYDGDGDALTYQWQLDARPAGSTATIANATTPAMSLVPDVAGVYQATVSVSDGRTTVLRAVEIRALASIASQVQLGFTPGEARYDSGLDKIVVTSQGPTALRLIDPFTGVTQSVGLPAAVKNYSLSPNGLLAVVLHEGLASLVDLQTLTVVRTFTTFGAQTDAFVDDGGFVSLIGGNQWVSPAITMINGRTGDVVDTASGYPGTFWGTQYGVIAGKLNKVFVLSQGLSPADISYYGFDPVTHKFTGSGESPYHGDFAMATPMFLSEVQDQLFTAGATFYRTSDLRYMGRLSGVTRGIYSLSNNTALDETLALEPASGASYQGVNYIGTYASVYKRFTTSLQLPQPDLSLPMIAGVQSYGVKVFHSVTGRHVLLVQTGSATPGAGTGYYVITR
ncbi:PKD domain-containing protein [Roseateles amylovorans]|uniref:Ig-like domain-containing protein n=1 Tax=Roseateles amylovorans TaxID=2978473 RepID=A0ABY6AY29_9BURK|nr:Ig-like domain-containing protein [Roseateles amylovorans]UXH78091.1 Ig-like domain-containing protein [Roseateles amylovorans]